MPDVPAIENVLDPPPASLVPTPTIGSQIGGSPGMTGMPGSPGMPTKPKPPKEKYIVWMYEGAGEKPNPSAEWNLYVVFDKRGTVVSVVESMKTSSGPTPDATTASGVRFGDSLFQLIEKYDWPEPFAQIGDKFFMNYPDKNVTFAIDKGTRKITSISVGLPLAVIYGAEKSTTPSSNGGPTTGGPGVLPGPGALPGPGGLTPFRP